jgi:hypothetical protein
VDIKDIKAIIDLMKKNSITEFELERQDSKIRLKRGPNGGVPIVQYLVVALQFYCLSLPHRHRLAHHRFPPRTKLRSNRQ